VLALESYTKGSTGSFTIAVPRLPRISNFDDLDPLRAEPGVRLILVEPGQSIPRDADLVILPGSKSTRSDLAALRDNGWDIDIQAHHRAGGKVLGLCGGYQMLGKSIADPHGIEGKSGESDGLGLLNVNSLLTPDKLLRTETATHLASGQPISGYHMHMGETEGPDRSRPFAMVENTPEGAISGDGRVMGTYLHGLFAADGFRRAMLGNAAAPDFAYESTIEQTLDALAAHLETHLNLSTLLALADSVSP
jgi:adenosylcobyric acid synthase